ncbi:nucleoside transporter 2, putative [Plasmodium berghei]|uniref:Nucleoside transporter 2, putative n=2 Tax=Plasmodium berghei TaxID=5821 RepID=A0A509AGD1_PLABA|nr:nucleoside transporter 2, putative [Plasmodium berghei ANKA]CXI23725.1 nucleoside transporter 2, putative [Plasmodium berghei]SCM20226.1 nucleoside transporter 2, putative [Plasmodium berghei]SCN23849.1 nucleoside transporter 2, putative [Plasmodium berghei]SCO59270.1 nucleoside transporter 2, putative [Plasmodium berghei]SCO60252.1 nucleoside transporter 2, putative [Plasmodium berghei]|eukprot:XP_034420808.1 nucleoside transporter 2, putative [Plasmodium berghei ANKA]
MNDASKNEDWENCTSIFPNERDEKIIELRNELEDDTIKKNENDDNNLFANITLCLMGMSSVLLYNCVLNTTPHIHALLNKDIIVSFTFFIYFLVLVLVSLFISLFIEVKTRIYDACFVLSFILQLLYPLVVKYYYKNTLLFYMLIVSIGATCSMMKTMIFSFSTIAVNSSKVICLSYGLTGIYSFIITTIFFYFVIQIDKDTHKLMTSIFITSSINSIFILVSFVCYTILKKSDSFKKKFKIYHDQKKIQTATQLQLEQLSYTNNNNTSPQNDPPKYFTINVNAESNEKNETNSVPNVEHINFQKKKEDSVDGFNTFSKNNLNTEISGNSTSAPTDTLKSSKKHNNIDTINIQDKNILLRFINLINIKRKEYINQGKSQMFLFKKGSIFLFCSFYNIFLKILVFPVVCPEMWTNNVDERYILIGMVQIADCISRIFPTCAQSFPLLKIFLFPQKKVLIYSLARTILSILCLMVPLKKIPIFDNFIFQCILIFSNIYLNGWFVVLSFINISDVLKPFNSMRNVAIISSLGSSFLRLGLLTGYVFSTKYKHFVNSL